MTEIKENPLDSLSEATMILAHPSLNVVMANLAAIILFDAIDAANLTSLSFQSLMPVYQPDGLLSIDRIREVANITLSEGFSCSELTCLRLNGENFPAEVRMTRFKQKGKDVLLVLVKNIQDHQYEEEQLQLAANVLRCI